MTQPAAMDRIQKLLSPEGRDRLDEYHILSLLPLRPYQNVAAMGCGPGFFTIPLAKALWGGKLYAVEDEEEVIELVRHRAKEARLTNVVPVKAGGDGVGLPQETLDGVFVACFLHALADRTGFLQRLAETLKRGAWCAVMEWRVAASPEKGPPPEQRVPEQEAVRLLKGAGLRVSAPRELNDYHYFVLAYK